jgi:coenzyme F420 hydrogenase subunit beta
MDAREVQGQHRLVESVIQAGICVGCGACVGICPYLDYFDGRVVVQDPCQADTWRCLQVCPRADYEGTALPALAGPMGPVQEIVMGRAADEDLRSPAQYGGVVSALLVYALAHGNIQAAVLTDAGGELSPGGRIARTRADVIGCSGSRYSASATLAALNRAVTDRMEPMAVVGLPCQMEALARMERMTPDGAERAGHVKLKVGLFCTWALDYRKLRSFLRQKGIGAPIRKFDIPPPPAEVFQVWTEQGCLEFPLSEIRELVQEGCSLCGDMTAEWADISVGTVEGRDGWNTVLARTHTGKSLLEAAGKSGWIELRSPLQENVSHLKEAAGNKRSRARAALEARGRHR